jgi:hypothetical protein
MELLVLHWTDLDWIKHTLKVERYLAREQIKGKPDSSCQNRKLEGGPWSSVEQ